MGTSHRYCLSMVSDYLSLCQLYSDGRKRGSYGTRLFLRATKLKVTDPYVHLYSGVVKLATAKPLREVHANGFRLPTSMPTEQNLSTKPLNSYRKICDEFTYLLLLQSKSVIHNLSMHNARYSNSMPRFATISHSPSGNSDVDKYVRHLL